jgi:hypothetical protein
VERSFGLAFTTLTIFAPLAHASHPNQTIQPEGTARPLEFVAAGRSVGLATPDRPGTGEALFARQVVLPRATGSGRAQSRVIYLNPDGAILYPGDSDSSRDISSVVAEPTLIRGWDTDYDTWIETARCVAELYAPFDVTVTDEDPGDAPHIEAVIGGSPADVGLPDNVAGVSPFATDCSIVERSIVFTFTDALPDDPRTVCEVLAQEIAHSFGLDHERLASDPMTYLEYNGERTFQDEMATCGEFSDRKCGINGTTCRPRQNSVALLGERLGPRGGGAGGAGGRPDRDDSGGEMAGCTVADGSSGCAMALALLGLRRRRR